MYTSLKSTFSANSGLQFCWCNGASSRCCLPNLRNSSKIRTYGSVRASKVIALGASQKRICNFLLVINSRRRRYRVASEGRSVAPR